MTQASELLPVIEIFGPTIQGEGPLLGMPTYFIRFGGCDYKCVWCDTKYAVDPVQVKMNSQMLTTAMIVDLLTRLGGSRLCKWVTLSGGNPALQPLKMLVTTLKKHGFKVAVETQGTKFQDWLCLCDQVVLAPKGPSSHMRHDKLAFQGIVNRIGKRDKPYHDLTYDHVYIKVVIFNEADLAFARTLYKRFPTIPFGLQVGNHVNFDGPEALIEKLQWLADTALKIPGLENVRILPQLHVLLWGNQKGK